MEVLGKLGIDGWLITAQIINFVLLLWLLKKYVYTPLIKNLENDEKKRRNLEAGVQILEDEKKQLQTDRDTSSTEAKKRSEQILEEAERIAEEVKATTMKEAEESKRVLLSLAQEEVKAEKLAVIEGVKKRLQTETREHLSETILKMKDSGLLSGLQRKYTDPMITEIKETPFTETQHIQGAVLAYAVAVDGDDMERIQTALREKLGHDMTWEVKEQSDLIAGYRLEAGGIELNHNFLEDITYATHSETS